jgi:preprotein translocase subunit SecA
MVLGQTARHHQIVCAALLTPGRIVEMPNGAGKTLAAALAAALTASRG